ncbi:PREDICTED: pinin-like [Papilio xuthus]|uniref:Pinin-like n=1 Tax=Papilio xuthus TaxID=66420 RepID=A0AAJ6ZTA2_PAPXU|nr:PREDICTED: pinin-like [Papilio xuthus]
MSDDCPNRKYEREYIDNSDIVIEKLKKQARRYRVVESRYNAKESILGNPCLDIEWHTAPLPKQCYCPVEPCICTSHLLKQGNLPDSIPVDTFRKATKEPDGTLIPRLAAAVEAEVEISKQLAQCGQLNNRGPEFCASHCPAFLTPVKESGFYAQKRKLIEKYIKDNKLEKKMQRLLNLKTNDTMLPKSASKKILQKQIEEFPEIIIPKTVVLPRPVVRRKKLTEKEEVEELEEILGIEPRKEGQQEMLLRSDSLSSSKERPGSSRTSAITPKRGAEPGRRPSCDSETIQPTESELNRAYNKIRTFKLKHLCEEDSMPSFSPTKRMVELKPRAKSNRIQECVADPAEIAEREKACEEDPRRTFKPEAKQVSSLYECKPRRISEPDLLSEPKKILQDEPKRISEPELRRIFEPRRMSLDDSRLTTGPQIKRSPESKRKPENESVIMADARLNSDVETKQSIELKSDDKPKPYPCKTKPTSGHSLGQTTEPNRTADHDLRQTSHHEQTHDLESKQTNEAANTSKLGGINKRESKRTADRKPIPKNESKRTFGYRRSAKKESKPICEPILSSEVKSGGKPEPRTSEFKKLFETKRNISKSKQISENERKSVLEVKKPPVDESKRQPESKKTVEEPRRVKEQRRTAKDASKYTSRGELKQTSDARRTPDLGSRQTSELKQPCGAIAIANLASAHPSRSSMPSRMSAGSGHSKRSAKSDKSSCDDNEDKGHDKRSDSARTASAASSRVASANQSNKPCPCFEDETDNSNSRGRRPGKNENCLCKAKECLEKFGPNSSGGKGPIGRTCHSVI